MPVNPYFNFVTQDNEQNLVEDLIVESIQIYGHSAYYIPRESVDMDRLFGEDPLSTYSDANEIELYIKTSQQFSGAGTFMSKFGLHMEDQITFLMSVRRFDAVLGATMTRPRENDIIYLNMNAPGYRYIFEIRYVNTTEQLFQLGKLYTYELRCETMNYSHERVQTSLPEINHVTEREAYTIKMEMGTGTGTYAMDEMIYQGASVLSAHASGTVADWNVSTSMMSVQNIVGEFDNTSPVVGVTTGASYIPLGVPSTVPQNLEPPELESPDLSNADNDLIQRESPDVLQPIINPRFNS
jgi:hypothetical protein